MSLAILATSDTGKCYLCGEKLEGSCTVILPGCGVTDHITEEEWREFGFTDPLPVAAADYDYEDELIICPACTRRVFGGE